MPFPPRAGFALPLALILSSSLLLLAVLILRQATSSVDHRSAELIHRRTETTLLFNATALNALLNSTITDTPGASALLEEQRDGLPFTHAVWVAADAALPQALHAPLDSPGGQSVQFRSPVGSHTLVSGLTKLGPPDNPQSLALAWTAEDLALSDSNTPPPGFWPLTGWDYAPKQTDLSFVETLDDLTRGTWRSLPWIPFEEPLPFLPEVSPALVPVVAELGLRFGIFASGSINRLEKVIRVRFFIDGEIWNPYNRPLQLHPGSGKRSVFQALFWNLPEVRLHNRSRGISSEWISLDAASNGSSGVTGLQGWIRTPGVLAAGQWFPFIEPDPTRQEEGLARTLINRFPVGPADRVEVEFRDSPGGLYAACLPLDGGDPLDAALEGDGWFRAEGYPVDWPVLTFPRADLPPQPFYLESGSLSFRLHNCQLRLALKSTFDLEDSLHDPRRKRVRFGEFYPSADGKKLAGSDLVSFSASRSSPQINPPTLDPSHSPTPLFSWPASEPSNLQEAMDLPNWPEGFRLGSKGATALNNLLDSVALWSGKISTPLEIEVLDNAGHPHRYHRVHPVNAPNMDNWLTHLKYSALPESASTMVSFHPFSHPPMRPANIHPKWSIQELERTASHLANMATTVPSHSAGDFLNRGLLAEAFEEGSVPGGIHQLMPLRGWLRNAPPLRGHGAAWCLHLAVKARVEDRTVWKSACLWLLETTQPSVGPLLELIRFEWTNPETHLLVTSP